MEGKIKLILILQYQRLVNELQRDVANGYIGNTSNVQTNKCYRAWKKFCLLWHTWPAAKQARNRKADCLGSVGVEACSISLISFHIASVACWKDKYSNTLVVIIFKFVWKRQGPWKWRIDTEIGSNEYVFFKYIIQQLCFLNFRMIVSHT